MTTASRGTAFAAMLILVAVSATAQTINLAGTVTNKMGKPVIGASVYLASDSSISAMTGGQKGWGSRYWDCCKPHCSSPFNTPRLAANCGKNGVDEVPCFVEEKNGWDSWNKATESNCLNGSAYACYCHVPFAVCEKLAYGYAAVPSGDDACGKCFQLDFDGGAHNGDVKEAHKMMKGKTLIAIASNIGHDVSGGQFDLMIPGGGLGQFRDGCKNQWVWM